MGVTKMADKPLTPLARECLGEYIIRQKNKGRHELPADEIKHAYPVDTCRH